MDRKRLGEVLTAQGALSQEQLEEALEEQGGQPGRLGESLVAKGLVSKADIGAAIQCVKGVAYMECPPEEIDPQVLALVPSDVAARCCALPVSAEQKTLTVAMGEPQNMALIEELEFCSGMTIDPRFSFRSDVVEGIRKFYGDVAEQDKAAPSPPIVPSPEPTSARTATLQKPNQPRMTWPVRVAFFGSLTIAALVGWASGTVVQQTLSGLLTGSGLSNAALSSTSVAEVSVGGDAADAASLDPGLEAPLSTPASEQPNAITARAEPLPTAPASTVAGPDPTAEESSTPPGTRSFGTTIQVGLFRDRANAERLVETLRGKHPSAHISLLETDLYSVRMGPFPQKQTADRIAEEIKTELDLSPLVLRTQL